MRCRLHIPTPLPLRRIGNVWTTQSSLKRRWNPCVLHPRHQRYEVTPKELKESQGKAESDIEPGKLGQVRRGGTS